MTTIEDIQDALRCHYGLSSGEGRQASITRAVSDIGRDSDIPEQEVMTRALTDTDLLREIAGRITVPESFFFRNLEQLEILVDFVRQRLLEGPVGAEVRIWSAGCSQGEEPLSLAMLLKETLPYDCAGRVHILGSDISRAAITAAREGIYSPWSFRGLDGDRKRVYFDRLDERRYRIRPDIRSMVEFRHCSIQEQLALILSGSIDVILFRNVAIYLVEEILEPLCDRLCSALKTDGLLCVSCSDPPIRYPGFRRYGEPYLALYRKSAASFPSESKMPPMDSGSVRTAASFFEELACRSSIPLHGPFLGLNEYDDVLPDALECELPMDEPIVSSDTASSNGRLEMLLDQADPQHYLSGQQSLTAGNHASAEEHFRKALFADPENLLIRFWYAVTLFEENAYKRAKVQMTALVSELEKVGRRELMSDNETSAGELLQSVRLFQKKMESGK